jgi:hypothetical protein
MTSWSLPRRHLLAAALAICPALAAAQPYATERPAPPVLYGATVGEDGKLRSEGVDPARLVGNYRVGDNPDRYRRPDGSAEMLQVLQDDGRLFVKFRDLPLIEVVFADPPKGRPPERLIFALRGAGRPALVILLMNDVGVAARPAP